VTIETARADLTGHHAISTIDPMGHLSAVIDATALDLREEQRVLVAPVLLAYLSERKRQQKPVPQLSRDVLQALNETQTSLAAIAPTGRNAPNDGKLAKPQCDDLIGQISDALKKDLASDVCKYALSDQSACISQMKATLAKVFMALVPGEMCTLAEARKAVLEFQTAIQPELTKVSGSNSLTNAPLQRFGFGLATGFIGGIDSDAAHPRVSIQSGKIAADPFARSLSMGLVNLPLWGYDTTTPEMTVRERIKPFIGAAFTPYFGMTVGAGWSFSRYLGINGGYAKLWYDVPKDTEQVDQAPVNKAAPFRLGSSNAWFVAASYNIGK
jgi:hypothetical protein